MKYINSKTLSTFLNFFMVIMLSLTILTLIGLPWIIREYMSIIYPGAFPKFDYYAILAILYIAGVLAAIILNALRKIFSTCKLENPFTYDNVKNLRVISLGSCIIGLTFVFKTFIINSLMTIVVIFVFIVASLFALILSEVFEKAVKYKEDSDYTI
ncbi:hypothetical protein AN1V17_22380 [Vallitalea sediminicola]